MIEARGKTGAVHVLRLTPGEDVRNTLESWIAHNGVQGAVVLGAVGSLRPAMLRFAGHAEGTLMNEDLEVCTMSGTLAQNGAHLHLIVSDAQGRTMGGHLLKGSIVRTTLELALQELDGITLDRVSDPHTGHAELFPH
ncbi:MAG: DUF296 domain-containing protein [Flavobacteriales bacterium]|nr:DUF296 domain-containing protein [Flavobacteriales bacterium]